MKFIQAKRAGIFCAVLLLIAGTTIHSPVIAQNLIHNPGAKHANKLEPMAPVFPTPNVFRSASGAPGPEYWQQEADYDIAVRLDDQHQHIYGKAKITYHNHSPEVLNYIWLQLDENQNRADSEGSVTTRSTVQSSAFTPEGLKFQHENPGRDVGVQITRVEDQGGLLTHYVQGTMMRVMPSKAIQPGETYEFEVEWSFAMFDRTHDQGPRGGFEYFPEDDNYIFVVTQWFPRMAVYNDDLGWNHKQFLGAGEFALNFGSYRVSIDVPADYVVAATGESQNYEEVLNTTQLERLARARTSNEPIEIITLEEALKNASSPKTSDRKTWVYEAENVRDFAWTASRRFVWDAMAAEVAGADDILDMSLYGKEAYPLFGRYSSKLTALTLETYSKYTLPYPYPVAISVESNNEMEYPMIAFNMGRVDENGEYTEAYRDYMIWIIIHEVGHNYFPMIVNSDERQWTFMDEGFNTFLQFITESEWDRDFPSRGGWAHKVVPYMSGDKNDLEPIMTSSDNTRNFYYGHYFKPAIALHILRETILGPEVFDFAFKTYVDRWAFKNPRPYDFFRTMEDASAVDLDWFWRGWFFTTDVVDMAIENVSAYALANETFEHTPIASGRLESENQDQYLLTYKPHRLRNEPTLLERDTSLQDHHYKARLAAGYVPGSDKIAKPEPPQVQYPVIDPNYLYEVTFRNVGGLVMPLILKWVYEDGSEELETLPVTFWRRNEEAAIKTFAKTKKVKQLILDPYSETADVDNSNQVWIF